MNQVTSNMAGTVWKILVSAGDQVAEGQDVVILESMKMEIPIQCTNSGYVTKIIASEGEFIDEGDIIIEIE